MELNELIKEALFQMYQSGPPDAGLLERLDRSIMGTDGKERESDGKSGACKDSEGGTAGRPKSG